MSKTYTLRRYGLYVDGIGTPFVFFVRNWIESGLTQAQIDQTKEDMVLLYARDFPSKLARKFELRYIDTHELYT